MPNCKKCNAEFEVPKNTIEVAFAVYCKPCIKKAMKKFYSKSIDEQIKLQAKALGL